ncbi:hypothetical protein DSO57_1029328 [Entomophthora muscae]|uniref:Uncharacterized protein n=1 Tax=Entomophthora muscae TaxID=34485 RepID=A0ACC2T180_9FUNG|nr:hypothetical protein DSO57_1029328 [Entomophthora muscae]
MLLSKFLIQRLSSQLPKNNTILRTTGFHTFSRQYAITQLTMPSMSPTMTEGSVSKWHVKDGDKYTQGDILLEIETDKAQIEVEAPEDGIMGKILTPAGSGKVPVGFPIALTAEEGDDISNLSAPDTSAVSSQKSSESVAPSKPVPSKPTSTKQQPPSPAVSHLLSNYVIKDVADIPATGPRGRLLKGDVLAYIATKNIPRAQQSAPTPKAAPKETLQPSSGYTDIPTTSMRRIIAQRLGESKSTVPHSYTSRDISMGAVNKLRQTLKNEYDIKVSVNDFVIRACALALRDVPEANVRYNPKLDDGVEKVKDIDISVAVATPTGLITPIVKNADQKGLKIISAEIKVSIHLTTLKFRIWPLAPKSTSLSQTSIKEDPSGKAYFDISAHKQHLQSGNAWNQALHCYHQPSPSLYPGS